MGADIRLQMTRYYQNAGSKHWWDWHTQTGSVKMAALHEFMEDQQVNLVAITECNAAWSKIDPELWPQEQMRFWWDSTHWSLNHNRQDPDVAAYQPGGMGLLVVNQLAHRAQRPGDDIAGLGWWCWACLHGKGNKYLRLISAYRPCPSAGPLSMYQQQVRYWSSKWNNSCPWEKWLHDLQEEILRWHEVGDYVVLMADMNEDVNLETIQHFCQETNLVEIISELYGPSPIPTHQWGQKAIDGIFVSRALILQHTTGGILQLRQVTPSDHCALWMDIHANIVEMSQHDPMVWLMCCCLKCNDPHIACAMIP